MVRSLFQIISIAISIDMFIFLRFLIVLEICILWHSVLVVLHQVVDMHLNIMNTVRIVDITSSVRHHIIVLYDLKQFFVEVKVFLIEETLLIPKAVFKFCILHALKKLLILDFVTLGQNV